MNFGLLGAGFGRLGASPKSGMSLSSLFAKYGGGMDFTNLDITKTWGPAGLKVAYKDFGNTPVASSGDGVALLIDKSKGAALGSELRSNFVVSTNGTPATIATYDAGTGAGTLFRDANGSSGILLISTGPCRVDIECLTNSLTVRNSNVGGTIFSSLNAGQRGICFVPYNNVAVSLNGNGSGTFTLHSCKPILGNHANQVTSGSRPQWQTGNKLVFDNVDDCLATRLIPTSAFTLIAKVDVPASISATQIINGANDGSSANRCFLALDTSGRVCGGVGSQSVTTILGSNDLRSTTKVLALTFDGSTVKLYENGGTVYSAAQSGSPTSTNAIYIGANNNNGSAASPFGGSIKAVAAFKGCLTPSEITSLTNLLGTT